LFFAGAILLRAQGYMAQIADGGGWDTTVTVVNTSDFAEQVTVLFFDENGDPLTLGIVGLGSYPGAQWNLPAYGVGFLKTTGAGASTIQGYATVNGRTVSATATFRWVVPGQPDFEVAVPALPLVQRMIFSFNNADGYATGIALVGHSLDFARLIVRGASGNVIGTHSIQLDQPLHYAFMLKDNYPETVGIQGTVEIDGISNDVLTPVIAAIALVANPTGPLTSMLAAYAGN